VREIPTGADLVLDLGGTNSITLKDYYATDPPVITYGPVVPPTPAPPPAVAELWVATAHSTTEVTAAGPVPIVELVIVSTGGLPAPGAKITAKWGGMIRATQTATTDGNGRVVFRMKPLRGPCSITFNVIATAWERAVFNPDRGVPLPLTMDVR
jgi:hypothetical protein